MSVCLFTPGVGAGQDGGVPPVQVGSQVGTGGVPPVPGQDRGAGGYPIQNSIACTCYAAGGMPLAFTQEDFLVYLIIMDI